MQVKNVSSRVKEIIEIVDKQDKWRGTETINLIASENVVSPLARQLLDSDFNHRYAEGDIGNREYQGARYIDELESIVVDLSKELFNSRFVEHRAISGALANMATYFGLTKPGQEIFALKVPEGAHISFREFGTAGARGLQVHDIPFDREKMNIDMDAFAVKIEEIKPAVITLGGSVFLFPHPVKEVKKACEEFDTKIHYDGAHVLGLIAGKRFQDPLREGADLLTGSTHKTFPGPQGALMFTNDEKVYRRISRAIFPGLVSNHHLGRMAPLAITLLEMSVYGEEYADQVIRNARHLGKVLFDLGLDVMASEYGFTSSHQIVVDVSSIGRGHGVAQDLEKCNIIANKNLIPCDDVSCSHDPSGLRLGVQEMTRFGMKEEAIEDVGHLIADVLLARRSHDEIKRDVIKLRSRYLEPRYCLNQES